VAVLRRRPAPKVGGFLDYAIVLETPPDVLWSSEKFQEVAMFKAA
jgi:hypothetical protein